jgi:hypothetical protein
MSVLGACWRWPILGEEIVFLIVFHMWRKRSMWKMKKKQHVEDEGKVACRRWRKSSVAHMKTNLAMLGLGFLI